jgi:hypothetical protein
MKIAGKAVAIALWGSLAILTAGCASSSLVKIWHDSSYQTPPMKSMLIIAVRKDGARRHLWEDAFARSLAGHGVNAVPSYRLFPDSPPDTSQIISSVKPNSFDGIMVILRLPTDTLTRYIPAYSYIDSYWPRYTAYYGEGEHEAYVDTQMVDIRAIDVITTGKGGHLIWSAQSTTTYPGHVSDVHRGIVRKVTAELARRGIIGAAP